jgi:small subunit ribosomal protein S15
VPLEKETRVGLIGKYRTHEKDTGSPEVQVAILTERIRQLTEHLNAHRKDRSSLRGLQKLVGQRRRLLKYLSRTDLGRYQELISQVGLRR